ncbi:hypothetical protein [Candidatus Accumulibacter phosphatis]|nr:hypothetical protein [Candidatus Accumulibacter phosphatis]
MSIRFRSTGSPIDLIKVFTLKQAASALMFNQTGKNCPTNIQRDNAEYAGFWDWYDILFDAINDEEKPLIARAHSDTGFHNGLWIFDMPTYHINRSDLEDWCSHKGIRPGFLIEETESTANNTTNKDIENLSTVYDVSAVERTISPTEQRIEVIIEVLSRAGYDPMSIPNGGKRKAMDECLKNNKIFSSESVFEAAWSVASIDGRLAMVNKEKYKAKKYKAN